MNIKHLFLTLIIGSFFSNAYGMQQDFIEGNNSIYQIINLTPESK